MARLSILGAGAAALGVALGLAVPHPASAQKNSGSLLPTTPPYSPQPYSSQPYPPPAYAPTPYAPRAAAPRPLPPVAGPQGGNPDVERLAQSLPLDPQTRELQDQMPADPRGTERRLGLREPRGPATDMRGRTPSPREIVDALAPR